MTSALRTLVTAVDRGYKSRSLRANRDRANRGACLPQVLTRAQPAEVALIKFKNCFGVELKRSENITLDSSCMSFDIHPAVPPQTWFVVSEAGHPAVMFQAPR